MGATEPGAGSGDPPDARGEDLERLGRDAFRRHDYDEVLRCWEGAYLAYRAAGDGRSAVRLARSVAPIHGTVRGDWAVASGWLARAKTLSEQAGPAEQGWVALTGGMFEDDRERKETLFREAMAAAREAGDEGLRFVAMSYYGASLVHGNRVEEGMRLLDEALAATSSGELDDPIHVEEVFCQLFSACEVAHDVDRADQWLRAGVAVAERTGASGASAYCHTHYGGVMTAAGRWAEAEASLIEGIRLWALGRRTLRGGAVSRLASLRVAQGRLDEAAALLVDLPEDLDSARPRASLSLARGDVARAREVLVRALREVDPSDLATVPLLGLLVEIEIAAGDLDSAAERLTRLAAFQDQRHGYYVAAMLALANGRLAQAGGSPSACDELRDAVTQFARARLPLESACARLELAAACARARPDLASAEARAALTVFQQLRAVRHADAATALLRSVGVHIPGRRAGDGPLTEREAQVLDLLGAGLTNPQIADRLVLSRKTVEHHVSRILTKLDLRNRSEAAAYAVRRAGTSGPRGPGIEGAG